MFTGLLRINRAVPDIPARGPSGQGVLDDFAKEGCGVYRTNIDLIARVAKRCGRVKAKAKANRRVKRARDPNSIHALGKSAIRG